jgi:hypothetical protein
LDRLKRLKCRYNKTEREYEYKQELVKSAKTTFEKQFSGVDEPMQTPAFDHENQDPFLDSEHTIQELHFAIKNLRAQSSPGLDGTDCLIIRNLPNETLGILQECSQTTGKLYSILYPSKRQSQCQTHIRGIMCARY